MYSAQLTISRIQQRIKERGDTQRNVLRKCGINENTLIRMTDNKGISSFYLAAIADELEVSVDYLLGRSDVPDLGTVNTVTPHESRLLDAFRSMSPDEQLLLLGRAETIAEQEQEREKRDA